MKKKQIIKILLMVCTSTFLLNGCGNNNEVNSETNNEVSEEGADSTGVQFSKDSSTSKNHGIETEEIDNTPMQNTMKISDIFNQEEISVWYQMGESSTPSYDEPIMSVYFIQNGEAKMYSLMNNYYFSDRLTLEDVDELTPDEVENYLVETYQLAPLSKGAISYYYTRDDSGNEIEKERVEFGSAGNDFNIGGFVSPVEILSHQYYGFRSAGGSACLVSQYNFVGDVEIVFNDISDEKMQED